MLNEVVFTSFIISYKLNCYSIFYVKCEEEIAKFYIDEELSEKDRISFIIKKGFSIQKSAVNFIII